MESNKDEAERCFAFAKKFISEGDVDKGLKYLYKADKLYPSREVSGKIVRLQCLLHCHCCQRFHLAQT